MERFADAVRLRFRAGADARWPRSDLVEGAPGMLNGEVARALHSRSFDALAGRFDEIAYGGAPTAARGPDGWTRVLEEARRE